MYVGYGFVFARRSVLLQPELYRIRDAALVLGVSERMIPVQALSL